MCMIIYVCVSVRVCETVALTGPSHEIGHKHSGGLVVCMYIRSMRFCMCMCICWIQTFSNFLHTHTHTHTQTLYVPSKGSSSGASLNCCCLVSLCARYIVFDPVGVPSAVLGLLLRSTVSPCNACKSVLYIHTHTHGIGRQESWAYLSDQLSPPRNIYRMQVTCACI